MAKVHPRVGKRHPELSDEDVLSAWGNAFWYGLRVTEAKDFEVAIGLDGKGRMVEMVAARDDGGEAVIFHAMTPPTKKTMLELGALRR